MRSSERLTFAAALMLAAITAAVRPHDTAVRLIVFLAIAGATLMLARAPPGGGRGILRDWLPVAEVLVVFLLLQPLIEAAVPWRLDGMLAALDARYFNGLVDGWRAAFGRPALFTDVVYVAYVSYYFLPITAAAVAWRSGAARFERTVFTLLLAFYLTFLGYLLLPASGPRLAAAEEASQLGGGAVSGAVRAFLRSAEATTLDAFPSGHATIAVVSCVLGSCLLGRLGAAALWLWAGAIVFATVYIHVHYVVDLVAGLVLAALVLALSPGPAASGERA